MNFQKIFILGAGAIGSSIGALLSANNNVVLIGKKAHADAINSRSLIIRAETERKFPIKAETTIRKIPSNSLIVLTTKAHEAPAAAASVKSLLRHDTTILVLQNGLGIKNLIQRTVGPEIDIVRGLTLMAAEFLEPGIVKYWNGQTIVEKSSSGKKIASLFNESGLRTTLSEDIEREEWSKLATNCVINPLTAILKVRNNEIATQSLREVRHRIFRECLDVAKAEGIVLEPNQERDLDRKILSYSNYSSMCQDIVKRKKTEIDFLNGAVVAFGKKHNVATPVNETLVGMIKFLETYK